MSRVVASAEDFLRVASQVQKVDVPVPELGEGCVIPVWQFTARELTKWERSNITEGPGSNMGSVRERYVVAVCRNDDGVALFTTDDVAKLAQCSGAIIERIIDAAKALNSQTQQQLDDAKKNSAPTTADA